MDKNAEAAALLRQGADEWNAWRATEGEGPIDLSGQRFADLEVQGANLQNVDMSYTSFHGVDLSKSVFSGSTLAHTKIYDSILYGVNLSGCDISFAKITSSKLIGADLTDSTLFRTNLRGSILNGATLVGTNFERAQLRGVPLKSTDCSSANFASARLVGVQFQHAKLMRCNFNGSSLQKADCSNANFDDATLVETNLHYTNLSHCTLRRASLDRASFLGTILAAADLTGAKGLECCKHRGPSILDFQTLIKTAEIPGEFLRGCGLPDAAIARLPEIIERGKRMPSCFISFSSADKEFATELHAALQLLGVRCWFAPEDMKIGDRLRTALDEAVWAHEKLLIVLSSDSIQSDWVEQEVETALARERKENKTILFPIRVDDSVFSHYVGWPSLITNTRNIGDFKDWSDPDKFATSLNRLVRDLKSAGGN